MTEKLLVGLAEELDARINKARKQAADLRAGRYMKPALRHEVEAITLESVRAAMTEVDLDGPTPDAKRPVCPGFSAWSWNDGWAACEQSILAHMEGK